MNSSHKRGYHSRSIIFGSSKPALPDNLRIRSQTYSFIKGKSTDTLESDLSKMDINIVRRHLRSLFGSKPNSTLKQFVSTMLNCSYDTFSNWINRYGRTRCVLENKIKMLYIWLKDHNYYRPASWSKFWEFISFVSKNSNKHILKYPSEYVKHEINIGNFDETPEYRDPKLIIDIVNQLRISENYTMDELDTFHKIYQFYTRLFAFKMNIKLKFMYKAYIYEFHGLLIKGPDQMYNFLTTSDQSKFKEFKKMEKYPSMEMIFLQQYSPRKNVPLILKETKAFPEKFYQTISSDDSSITMSV